LPWSKNQSPAIVRYILSVRPEILCLQEVFTTKLRTFFTSELTRYGYTVVSPRDEGVTLLGSGLLIAFVSSRFRLLSESFYPFTAYHSIEIGANKGFQTVRLLEEDGSRFLVVNTHTQSDTAFSFFSSGARRAQFAEMVRWLEMDRDPALLMGDMNCEHSPHPHIRFLQNGLARKSTFPRTGEDLDHIAWIPTQWVPSGMRWCQFDRKGIHAIAYRVDPVPWSDHFPVVADLVIEKRSTEEGECDGP
jgi:endonuclease/exonuclease/phosphatase family metal-dependent hydrolase